MSYYLISLNEMAKMWLSPQQYFSHEKKPICSIIWDSYKLESRVDNQKTIVTYPLRRHTGYCNFICFSQMLSFFYILIIHYYSEIPIKRFSTQAGTLFFQLTELKTKTNPNGHRVVAVWVRFGFQLGLRQIQALIIIYTMHCALSRL